MVAIVLSYVFFGGIAIALIGLVIAFRVLIGWDTENTAWQALSITMIGALATIVSFFGHLFISNL